MKKGIKKGFVLVFILTIFSSMPVFAKEVSKEPVGSITIQLEDTEKNHSKENVVFQVTKIADLVDGKYVMDEDYADVGIDLNCLKTANEMEEVCKKLGSIVKKEYEITTNKEGIALLKNLPLGVYFIHSVDTAGYEKVTSFLASIPTWSETEQEIEYEVHATPKHFEEIETDTPGIPSTGDEANIGVWIAMATGSIFIMVPLILLKRKEK